MDQEAKHISFKEFDTHHSWVIMEDNKMSDESISSSSSSRNSSTALSSSSSISDLMEDASSTSSSCSSSSNGPLYELSELMSHLPIKRGLSKYYQGKSQSFTSLASVKRREDLEKKERKVMRSSCKSKSYGDINKYRHSPKAVIAKKVSRGGSFLSSSLVGKRSATCFRPPTIPVQKNLF